MTAIARRVRRYSEPGRWYSAKYVRHNGACYILPEAHTLSEGATVMVEACAGAGLEVFRSRSMVSRIGMAYRMEGA